MVVTIQAPFAHKSAKSDNCRIMTRVCIGIGSNVGDRQAHVDFARAELARIPATKLLRFSLVYRTPPLGPVPQDDYLNAAALLETALSPAELHPHLRDIEARAGRAPIGQRITWGPRELDLDIELFGDVVLSTPDLRIPHPHLHERTFVLEPLVDLDPSLLHPVLRKTVRQLLDELLERQRRGG